MNFKDIPNKYRPVPFWSWNDKLNTEETKLQIEKMAQVGIGGFFMHARGGLQTEYMSKEWFDNISASLYEAEELDMLAWGYDENGWPSGFGNGVVNGWSETTRSTVRQPEGATQRSPSSSRCPIFSRFRSLPSAGLWRRVFARCCGICPRSRTIPARRS